MTLERPKWLAMGLKWAHFTTASYKKKHKEVGAKKMVGCQKKVLFSKMILDHMACQNKCFWHV